MRKTRECRRELENILRGSRPFPSRRALIALSATRFVFTMPGTRPLGSCPNIPTNSARNIDASPSDVKTMRAASGTFFLPCS